MTIDIPSGLDAAANLETGILNAKEKTEAINTALNTFTVALNTLGKDELAGPVLVKAMATLSKSGLYKPDTLQRLNNVVNGKSKASSTLTERDLQAAKHLYTTIKESISKNEKPGDVNYASPHANDYAKIQKTLDNQQK